MPSYTYSEEILPGTEILIKGDPNASTSGSGIGKFYNTQVYFKVYGNIMSLVYGDDFKNKTSLEGKDYAFYYLFQSNKIIDASNLVLPATTLSDRCYSYMFSYCEFMTKGPKVLPAQIAADYCY